MKEWSLAVALTAEVQLPKIGFVQCLFGAGFRREQFINDTFDGDQSMSTAAGGTLGYDISSEIGIVKSFAPTGKP